MYRFIKTIFVLILLAMFSVNLCAILTEYSFTSTNGTFTEITGGTLLGDESSDDQRFVDPESPGGGTDFEMSGVGFPIGFNFNFNETVFNRIGINYNGWISFGQSTLTPSVITPSGLGSVLSVNSDEVAPAVLINRIAGLNDDLAAQTGSSLRIQTIGNAPNRICVIQWLNCRRWSQEGSNINFQIKLYETTNNVEFVYGTNTFTSDTSCQVGLRSVLSTDFNIRTTTDNWNNTTAATSNTATCFLSNTVFPTNGQIFTWTPPVPGSIPNPANLVGPTGDFVSITANLEWLSGGGMPSGYRLYFGTDNPPTNIINNLDLGNVNSYNPTNDLLYNTTYYMTVIPYNEFGTASNCPVWSFTTRTDPSISVFPYLQDFSGDVLPPTDWTRMSGLLNNPSDVTLLDGGWYFRNFGNVNTETNMAAVVNIYFTQANYWLVTPPINIGSTGNYQLEFDMALTSYYNPSPANQTGTDDKFAVVVSTDNGTTWSSTNTLRLWDNAGSPFVYNNISTTGEHVVINFSGYSGTILVGFYGESTEANADNDLFIDNVLIRQSPTTPQFSVSPLLKEYGNVQIQSTSAPQRFTISNTGIGNFNVSSITLSGTDVSQFVLTNNNTLPAQIGSNQIISFNVAFAPTSLGEKSASVTITDDLTRTTHTIALTGTGYDGSISTFPYLEEFSGENFPPTEWYRMEGILAAPSVVSNSDSYWWNGSFGNIFDPENPSARIDIWNTSVMHWLVTPSINLGNTTDYQLEFDLALTQYGTSNPAGQTGTDDKFAVVISTDNGSTWTSVNTLRLWDNVGSPFVYNEIATIGQHVIINLSQYSGYVRIAFYGESTVSNADNDLFVDNVKFIVCPTTPLFSVTPIEKNFGPSQINMLSLPQNFAISNIGIGQVGITSIQIIGPDAGQFQLLNNNTLPAQISSNQFISVSVNFMPTSLGPKTATLVITDNLTRTAHNIPLSGIGFDSSITTFPFELDFENITFPLMGWKIVSSSNSYSGWRYNTDATTAHSGNASVQVGYTNADHWMITPPIHVTNSGSGIKFWMRDYLSDTGWDYPDEFTSIRISTTSQDTSSFTTELARIDYLATTPEYQEFTVNMLQYIGQTVYIGFMRKSTGGNYVYMDDFYVGNPALVPPTNLQASVSNSSVTLTWESPLPNRSRTQKNTVSKQSNLRNNDRINLVNFKVYRNGTEIALLPSTVLSYIDTELINGITYNYYVTAVYTDPEGESGPSNAVQAIPDGSILNPPVNLTGQLTGQTVQLNWQNGNFTMNEGFENEGIPTNWNIADIDEDGYNWFAYVNAPHTGGQCLASASWTTESGALNPNNWIITPAINVGNGASLFWWVAGQDPANLGDQYKIYISTVGNDPSDFNTSCFSEVVNTTSWTRKQISLSNYAGQTIWIAFAHQNSPNHFILKLDDITVVSSDSKSINFNCDFESKQSSRSFSCIQEEGRINQVSSRTLTGYKIYKNDLPIAQTEVGVTSFADLLNTSGAYTYYVTALYQEGESEPSNSISITGINDIIVIPTVTALKGNYPNPFNPTTSVAFDMAKDGNVNIDIYNAKGQKVNTLINEFKKAGSYKTLWNGKDSNNLNCGSGIYFYRMKSGNYTSTGKMILMK